MRTATQIERHTVSTNGARPSFLSHPTFADADAEQRYGGIPTGNASESLGFLPDEATRDYAQRMHYAGWRAARATTVREVKRWCNRYFEYRDRIVLGNRKLTFRAVRKWSPRTQLADDMAAECQIVLIKAVAAYNPWMGIRFSTYAFTCLMRALSRLSQRQAADRLSRALPLDALPFGEPSHAAIEDSSTPAISTLEQYLRTENPLLTPREKSVLLRRYHLHDNGSRMETLEQVGRDLGLSKERVRQVQKSALGKLREVLAATSAS